MKVKSKLKKKYKIKTNIIFSKKKKNTKKKYGGGNRAVLPPLSPLRRNLSYGIIPSTKKVIPPIKQRINVFPPTSPTTPYNNEIIPRTSNTRQKPKPKPNSKLKLKPINNPPPPPLTKRAITKKLNPFPALPSVIPKQLAQNRRRVVLNNTNSTNRTSVPSSTSSPQNERIFNFPNAAGNSGPGSRSRRSSINTTASKNNNTRNSISANAAGSSGNVSPGSSIITFPSSNGSHSTNASSSGSSSGSRYATEKIKVGFLEEELQPSYVEFALHDILEEGHILENAIIYAFMRLFYKHHKYTPDHKIIFNIKNKYKIKTYIFRNCLKAIKQIDNSLLFGYEERDLDKLIEETFGKRFSTIRGKTPKQEIIHEIRNRNGRFELLLRMIFYLCKTPDVFIKRIITPPTPSEFEEFFGAELPTDLKEYKKKFVWDLESEQNSCNVSTDNSTKIQFQHISNLFLNFLKNNEIQGESKAATNMYFLWSGQFSQNYLDTCKELTSHNYIYFEGTRWVKLIEIIYNKLKIIFPQQSWLHNENQCGNNAIWAAGSCIYTIAAFLSNIEINAENECAVTCLIDWAYNDYHEKMKDTIMFKYEIPLLVELMRHFNIYLTFNFLIFYHKPFDSDEEYNRILKEVGNLIHKFLEEFCYIPPLFKVKLVYTGIPEEFGVFADVYDNKEKPERYGDLLYPSFPDDVAQPRNEEEVSTTIKSKYESLEDSEKLGMRLKFMNERLRLFKEGLVSGEEPIKTFDFYETNILEISELSIYQNIEHDESAMNESELKRISKHKAKVRALFKFTVESLLITEKLNINETNHRPVLLPKEVELFEKVLGRRGITSRAILKRYRKIIRKEKKINNKRSNFILPPSNIQIDLGTLTGGALPKTRPEEEEPEEEEEEPEDEDDLTDFYNKILEVKTELESIFKRKIDDTLARFIVILKTFLRFIEVPYSRFVDMLFDELQSYNYDNLICETELYLNLEMFINDEEKYLLFEFYNELFTILKQIIFIYTESKKYIESDIYDNKSRVEELKKKFNKLVEIIEDLPFERVSNLIKNFYEIDSYYSRFIGVISLKPFKRNYLSRINNKYLRAIKKKIALT